MAATYVSITEEWIREKLQLQHKCLADVRSLSLPGTYEGKIRHLGSSLKNFVHLKVLDLSYNALLSLQGVQHLKLLEVLNVYYNRVSSLTEVQLLCELKALREVDLRLNPVAQRSTDYRLLLVHTLPLLRSIDDCPVRDRERKACILHFSSDVTLEPRQVAPDHNPDRNPAHSSGRSRIALVSQMTKKRCFLDDSDEAVLNLVAKSNLHLREPGGTNKEPRCQMYGLQDNLEEGGDKTRAENFLPSKQGPADCSPRRFQQGSDKRGTRPSGVATSSSGDRAVGGAEGSRVSFTEPWRKSYSETSGGVGQNRVHTHPRTPAEWNFTPKPEDTVSPCSQSLSTKTRPTDILGARCEASCRSAASGAAATSSGRSGRGQEDKKQQEATVSRSFRKYLAVLLELVEEHWDGKGSLQCNRSFLARAAQILSNMEQDGVNLCEGGICMKEKVPNVDGPRRKEEEEPQADIQNLHRQLEEAQSSIAELNKQLTVTLEENLSLQKELIKSERRWLKWQMNTVPQFAENQRRSGGLRKQVQDLGETVQQAGRVQHVGDVLQASHKTALLHVTCSLNSQLVSLVAYERLLWELAEEGGRQEDVKTCSTSASELPFSLLY